MTRDDINNQYFKWMYNLVCEGRHSEKLSYKKLLLRLHNTEFTFTIPYDSNRAEDGVDLRRRFALLQEDENLPYAIMDIIDGPCSVLEMILALAIRCEENIMDDPKYGDRTRQWFWGMITSLGLGGMYDRLFDRRTVDDIVAKFLNRDYAPDGAGGLFTIKRCNVDLRTVEIWYQLLWYMNGIS